MSRVSARLIAFAALISLSGCLGRCGGDAPPETPPEVAATPAPEPATPADPVLAAVAELAERAVDLPEPEAGVATGPRETFRRDALTLGNQAVDDKRMDVVLAIADVLVQAEEVKSATAFLQRAVGLLKPTAGAKEHLLALADLKRIGGKPLEGASLMERAVDIEPPDAGDFVGLSRMYLAAGRIGPARAAVTRGLRAHPTDAALAIQGAEVQLVQGQSGPALAAIPGEPAEAVRAFALRVKAEAQLVAGDLPAATATAKELAAVDEAWGALLSGAAAVAQGKDGGADLAQARGLAVGRAGFDVQQALPWAEALVPGSPISPWPRTTGQAPPTPKPAPAPAPMETPSPDAPQ